MYGRLGKARTNTIQWVRLFLVQGGSTCGSVPLMFLFPWMDNFPYPWEGPADIVTEQQIVSLVMLVVLVIVFGRQGLGRKNLSTEVTAGRAYGSQNPVAAVD